MNTYKTTLTPTNTLYTCRYLYLHEMLLASLQQRAMGPCVVVPAGHAWHKGPHRRHLPVAGHIGMSRWTENYAIVEHGWVTDNGTDNEEDDDVSDGSELSEDEDVIALTRLVVRQLPHSITADELKAFFEPHGTVLEVDIPKDWSAAEAKNIDYATVDFMYPEQALAARQKLDGMHYLGRIITVHTPKDEELVIFTHNKAEQKKQSRHDQAVADDFEMAAEAMARDNINVRLGDPDVERKGGDSDHETEDGMCARRAVQPRADSPVLLDGRDERGKKMKKVVKSSLLCSRDPRSLPSSVYYHWPCLNCSSSTSKH